MTRFVVALVAAAAVGFAAALTAISVYANHNTPGEGNP